METRGQHYYAPKNVNGKLINTYVHNEGVNFYVYDKTLQENEISVSHKLDLGLNEGRIILKDKILFLNSIYDGSKTSEQLFATVINSRTGAMIYEQKKLVGTDDKLPGGMFSKFDFVLSADSSKFMIHYKKLPASKDDSKNREVIGLYVFDSDLNQISGGEYRMSQPESKMTIEGYSVSNSGAAQIMAIVEIKGEDERGRKRVYNTLQVLSLAPEAEEFEAYNINTGGTLVSNIKLVEGNGKIFLYGTFSKSSDGVTEGLYVSELVTPGLTEDPQLFEIPDELFAVYEVPRLAAGVKKKIENDEPVGANRMDTPEITFLEDGGFLFRVEENDYYGSSTLSRQDIYVIRADANWSVNWVRKIPKYQRSVDYSSRLSYRYEHFNGTHAFFFLDNALNENITEDKWPEHYVCKEDGALRVYVIDENSGEVSNLTITRMQDVQGHKTYYNNTNRITNIGNGEFAYRVYKKKKEDIIVRFTIN
tara:strand:- start:133 stop:1566 length:1434 start_codon:yes stop_codon:yes gene_type:complete